MVIAMDEYTAMEESYKNGYDKGYADAKANTVSIGVLDQVRWERDVAIKQLEEHGIPFCGKAPDVVKVVRCKDCKQYNGHRYCTYFAETVLDDDFCSYGERKDNEID